MSGPACYFLTDPTSTARDLYCPRCADLEWDPYVAQHLEASTPAEEDACVVCDRVWSSGEFVVPDCWNCGAECLDRNGNAFYAKFGLPHADPVYICGKCFSDHAKRIGVVDDGS